MIYCIGCTRGSSVYYRTLESRAWFNTISRLAVEHSVDMSRDTLNKIIHDDPFNSEAFLRDDILSFSFLSTTYLSITACLPLLGTYNTPY